MAPAILQVIACGHGRTGTTSLQTAFEILGMRVSGYWCGVVAWLVVLVGLAVGQRLLRAIIHITSAGLLFEHAASVGIHGRTIVVDLCNCDILPHVCTFS